MSVLIILIGFLGLVFGSKDFQIKVEIYTVSSFSIFNRDLYFVVKAATAENLVSQR